MPVTKTSPVNFASWVQNASAYQGQKNEAPIDLKLDANERAASPNVNIDSNDIQFHRYPDKRLLEAEIAEKIGVTSEHVIVTSGGDDAIDRVCRLYLQSDRNIIIPVPTFEMIERYARQTGAAIKTVPWKNDFPVSEIISSCDEKTSLIAVVSPAQVFEGFDFGEILLWILI